GGVETTGATANSHGPLAQVERPSRRDSQPARFGRRGRRRGGAPGSPGRDSKTGPGNCAFRARIAVGWGDGCSKCTHVHSPWRWGYGVTGLGAHVAAYVHPVG